MRTFVFTAIVAVLFSQSLHAGNLPTAEETVAFILYGAEDGFKVVKRDKVIAIVTQTAKSPADFSVNPQGKLELRSVSVQEVENCQFRVSVTEGAKASRSYLADFDKVNSVTFVQGYGLLDFSGSCAVKGDDGSCNKVALLSAEMGTPPQRVKKAIAYMKETFCKGAAF